MWLKISKNVKVARDFYARTVVAYMKGDKQPYMQSFQFKVEKGGTGESDKWWKIM